MSMGAAPADGIGPDDPAPFGWSPVLVLVAVMFIDRIETSLVAGVLPLLQAEWGFSDSWAGAIPAAAAIAGVVVSLPAGYLADRVTRTTMVAVIVALWSVITVASGVAPSFAVFFATRVLLGMADSIDNPAVFSLFADYYPPQTRARVYGYHRIAYFVGGALGVLLGGVIGQAYGWRVAFFSMAVPGLIAAVAVWRLREPVRGQLDRVIASGVSAETANAPAPASKGLRVFLGELRMVVQVRTVQLTYVGLTALFIGLNGIFFWLPSLYRRELGLGEGAAGALTAAVGLVGVVGGAWLGGRLGDLWHGRRDGARVVLGGGGLLTGSVLLFGAVWLDSLPLQPLGITVAVFLLSIAIPNLTATVADVLPAARRGAGFAVLQLLVVLGSSGGPLLVGALSDAADSLQFAFAALTVPMVLGSLVVLRARRTADADAARVLEAARVSVEADGFG